MHEEDEVAVQKMLRSSIAIHTMSAQERDHFKVLQQAIGQNFISVLNDPRESEQKGSWIPSMTSMFDKSAAEATVKPVRIPSVSNTSIQDYVKTLGGNYEAWKLSKTKDASAHKAIERSEVPPAFAATTFDLLRSPDLVSSLCPESQDPLGSQMLASRLEYFKKLTDKTLLAEVKVRSPHFFTALQNFTHLQDKVTDSLGNIASLREKMRAAKQSSVAPNLRILALKRRLENQRKVLAISEKVRELKRVVDEVRGRAEDGQHEEVFSLLEGSQTRFHDLRKIDACAGLLTYLEDVKGRSFDNASQDFVAHITVGFGETNQMRGDSWPDLPDVHPEQVKIDYIDKCTRLFTVVLSTDMKSLRGCLSSYRDTVIKDVKKLVSNSVIKSMQILHSDPSLPPEELLKGAKLRELTVQQFNFVLEQLFHAVYHVYRKVLRVTKVLSELTEEKITSGLDKKSISELLAESRMNVVRMVQSRIVRMFEVRVSEHTALTFHEMYTLVQLSFKFIFDLERLSEGEAAMNADSGGQRSTASLRGTLASQAKAFFKKQHDKQQRNLVDILMTEQWVEAPALQGFTNRLIDTSEEMVSAAKKMNVTEAGMGVLPGEPDTDETTERLTLGGNSYTVSQSILMLLKTLAEYEKYVFAMPFLGHEVSQRIHELLKFYDGQTAALVLGAGARDTAGLEAITVSHLAVSAQCLSFLADFAPRFRTKLEAVLPAQSTVFLQNLDRFSRDAINHRNEFYVKIILMVKEGPAYTTVWKPANWSTEVTPGINALLKEVGRILRKGGLERVLDRQQLRLVLYPILYHYYVKIKTCVTGLVNLRGDDQALQKVTQDLLHYKANVENFGFSVLRSAVARDVADTSWHSDAGDEALPEADSEVLALFI